jgi:hypothetical protein
VDGGLRKERHRDSKSSAAGVQAGGETRGQAPESEGASGHQAGTGKPSPSAQKATVKAPPYAGRADPMQELGKLNISDPVRTLVGLDSGKRDYRSRETALRKMTRTRHPPHGGGSDGPSAS